MNFRDLLIAGACDILQPNVVRVGWITPLLRIAELARTFGVPVYPQRPRDLRPARALPAAAVQWPRRSEDASLRRRSGLLAEPYPVSVDKCELRAGDHAGLGLRWKVEG